MALLNLLLRAIDAYMFLLAIYALLSWFPQAYGTRLAKWLDAICGPYLEYFSFFRLGPVSFSVIAGVLFLQLVRYGLVVIFLRFL